MNPAAPLQGKFRVFATTPCRGISFSIEYVSGTALSDSMIFNNTTFASLGVTPGTYEWTWGTGLPNQNFTLMIGTVSDGGSTVSLLGCALLDLAAQIGLLRAVS